MVELNNITAQDFKVEGARRKLLWFAQYMNPRFKPTPFHTAYYRILDMFATGLIQNLIIQAPPQHGKALKVETPVLTTNGWKAHGELQPGDYVFGPDGKPKLVKWNSGKYEWHTMRVNFADGFNVIAAHEHEWMIYADHDDHKGRILERVETQKIFARRNRRKPYIAVNEPLQMPNAELPIDPYLFGVWLGDGYSDSGNICCGKEDIETMRVLGDKVTREKTAYRIHVDGLTTKLRQLGVIDNKHIPMQYMLASYEQRKALLRGLMDTDGCVNVGRGMCEFCQKKGRLADDVFVLLRTLGYKPTRHEYTAYLYGKDCGKKVRICFIPDKGDIIFGIERKQARLNAKTTKDRQDKKHIFITSTTENATEMVNCIEVEDGIYLAGYELIPTHNSEGSSRNLPAKMLGMFPDKKIILCSYAATIAKDFNRDVQKIIDTQAYNAVYPETTLNGSNVVTVASNYLRNSDVFQIVGHTGEFRVVGRGGSLTSKTADVMIFDDLYKDSAEANSPIIRAGAWDWYTKVARTRLHNDSQQLIVFTRWHPEDIIGKIIDNENVIVAECWADFENIPKGAWVLVNFEAIKTGDPTEIDPREKGVALWESRHSIERLEAMRKIDPVGFQCLYQGNPGDAAGRLYQPFKTWVEKSDWGTLVRKGCYIDVADEGDDYLAGATYDIYKSPEQVWNENKKRWEPLLYALITDVEYTDENTDITTVTVPRMINEQGTEKVWVESNNGGSQYEKTIKRKIRAISVPFYQGSNKESRIVTNAPFVNQCIVMPFGWETRYPKFYKAVTEFLRKFDANEHDDAADMLTGIYEKEIADGNVQPYGHANRGVRVH